MKLDYVEHISSKVEFILTKHMLLIKANQIVVFMSIISIIKPTKLYKLP